MTITVNDELSSMDFKDGMHETVKDVQKRPTFTEMVTETLSDTGELIKSIVMFLQRENDKIMEASSNREDHFRRFVEAAARTNGS